jgi:hypothetical protein
VILAQGLQLIVREAEYFEQEILRAHGGSSSSAEWHPLMQGEPPSPSPAE